ncbi:unnamed protein product [Paramecium pentaurelia]|uniref:Uncharacterized protein n=1 Tax=Paramecium pentaurelia TaxID=43138 RepID=A0A8S1XV85_9CILI|nr:unnamed protein product [Paramecium pentaurelia]
MGNDAKSKFTNQEFDEDWEIIDAPIPKKILNLRQSTLNKSIFTVIDYQQQPENKQQKGKALFSGNHPEKQTKKYYISKRIQELQHQIGGETLFGVKRGHGPIQLGEEHQQSLHLEDRPKFPRKHTRAPVNVMNLQLD